MKTQSAVNRILLALAGLVLLGGGLLVLAAGLDLYRRRQVTPPAGWPLVSPHDVLLGRADRTRFNGQDWWWPGVIATLILIMLLALWWLLSQLHRRTPGRLPVGSTPPQNGVELRDRALSEALAAESSRLPGVQQVRARFVGRPAHPQARITITLTPDGAPSAVLKALHNGPLEHARRSAGWERITAEVQLHGARHSPHRAE